MFEWRLDTHDVIHFNGSRKGVRVIPETNKCTWTWAEGHVVNIYSRGAILGVDYAPDEGRTLPISVEPKFFSEVYSLVPGSIEGTIDDPLTDSLTGLCVSDAGPQVHACFDGFKFGTAGWRVTRFKYGIMWQVSASQIAGVWRWLLTGTATWSWTWRNTAKYIAGNFNTAWGLMTRAGHWAGGPIYGGASDAGSPVAGVRTPDRPVNPGTTIGSVIPQCETFSHTHTAFNFSPGQLATSWAEPVTREIAMNLNTTPASSPPGHRLFRGPSAVNDDFPNQLRFQYASTDPISCSGDLFSGRTISMELLPGISDVDNGHYAYAYGLSLPSTIAIAFSNS